MTKLSIKEVPQDNNFTYEIRLSQSPNHLVMGFDVLLDTKDTMFEAQQRVWEIQKSLYEQEVEIIRPPSTLQRA